MILKGLNSAEVLGVLRGTTTRLVYKQTPKLSRILDAGNHVLNGLGDHGLERIRGDVVEGKRGRISATASIVIRPPLIREFSPTVFSQVARLMTKSTRGAIVDRTRALRAFNRLNHLKSCICG